MNIGVFAKEKGSLCNNKSPISLGETNELPNLLMSEVEFYNKIEKLQIIDNDYLKK